MDTQSPKDPSALTQVIAQLTTVQTELTEIKQLLVSVTELEWLLKKYLPEVRNTDTLVQDMNLVKDKRVMTYNTPVQELQNQSEYLLECQNCGFIWTSKKLPKRCNGPRRCKNWTRKRNRTDFEGRHASTSHATSQDVVHTSA